MKKVNPKTLLLLAALVLLGAVPFAQVGGFGFVAYMDRVSIEDLHFQQNRLYYINPHVQEGLTRENALWAFSTMQFSQEALTAEFWRRLTWHPLSWLSLLADSTFWKMDPGGFHLTNLFLHLFSTVLCYLVAMRLTRNRFVGFCTAALFCLHPVQVSAVGWISARPAILGGFFFFLSMLMYLRYGDIQRGQPGRRLYYLLSVFACACAVLSKTSNVILPLLFGLTDWRFHRKGFDRDKVFKFGAMIKHQLADKWLYYAFSVAILVVASPFRFMRRPVISEDFNYGNFFTGIFSHLGHYLEHVVFPIRILPLYFPFPQARVGFVYFGVGLLCFLLLSGSAWAMRRSRPQLIFGWLWFLLCMLPVAGIGHVRASSFTIDYELYPALFGVFFCVTSIAFRPAAKAAAKADAKADAKLDAKAWGTFGVFAVLIVACGYGAFVKVGAWKDNAAQVAHIKTHNEDTAGFYQEYLVTAQADVSNLAAVKEKAELLREAYALRDEGKQEQAIEAFLALRREDPSDPSIAHVLGQLSEEKNPGQAEQFYVIACELTNNDDAGYLYDAALFFLNQRNAEKAAEYHRLANGASAKPQEIQERLDKLEREIMNLLQ